jgi:hypothetical protein
MGDLNERVDGLERRVAAMETATAVANAHNQNVEKRLSAIEDTLKWLVRLILGALLLGLIGFIVSGGIAGV